MELMFDLQQYGQPPAEIIGKLAPGLKFDENGMPIMPNMGAGNFAHFPSCIPGEFSSLGNHNGLGMVPEMPGGQGLPNLAEMSENMASGQCSIC